MRENVIYLAPSPFEACFVSAAHNNEVVDRTIEVAAECFKQA